MVRLDKKFLFACLLSMILHGGVVFLCPGMEVKDVNRKLNVVSVSLIEEPPIPPVFDKAEDTPLPDEIDGRISDDILKEGLEITNNLFDKILREGPDKVITLPDIPSITRPKQSFQPDDTEYVKVWQEELPITTPKGIKPAPAPAGAGMLKGTSVPPQYAGIEAPLFKDEFYEEGQIPQPEAQTEDITWEGKPRQWIKRPENVPTYSGDTEGIVKVKFWVDKQGEVVNAIPVKKLSPGLEKKALDYIFEWRFEPMPEGNLQEGVISITFTLERQGGRD